MSLVGVFKYILTSAVFVVSLLLSLRMIFAHDLRRETWRSTVKRYIHVSRARFKTWTVLMGWILLLVALSVAYFQIDKLISNQ